MEVNGDLLKAFLFYAIVNHQFKTRSEKCGEVGGVNSLSLKVLLERTGNVHFCTICEINVLVGVP